MPNRARASADFGMGRLTGSSAAWRDLCLPGMVSCCTVGATYLQSAKRSRQKRVLFAETNHNYWRGVAPVIMTMNGITPHRQSIAAKLNNNERKHQTLNSINV